MIGAVCGIGGVVIDVFIEKVAPDDIEILTMMFSLFFAIITNLLYLNSLKKYYDETSSSKK